jgi:glycosyltransferase involved in cell wall biosynthesis
MPVYEDIRVALEYQKDDDIPIIIPVFNTATYLSSMVEQLEKLNLTNIIICDNGSTYPPMLQLLDELSNKYHVVEWGKNMGPRVYTEDKDICSKMPKNFIVTDPDLLFNPEMPKRAIDKMKRIIDTYGISKTGLAIDIDSPDERKRFFNAHQVDLWERNYWSRKVEQYPERDDLYAAPIDTTFCLYDRDKFLLEIDGVPGKMTCNTSAIRIAGRFTCRHMGWWEEQPLTEEEYDFYKNTHTWSSTENEKKRLGY